MLKSSSGHCFGLNILLISLVIQRDLQSKISKLNADPILLQINIFDIFDIWRNPDLTGTYIS